MSLKVMFDVLNAYGDGCVSWIYASVGSFGDLRRRHSAGRAGTPRRRHLAWFAARVRAPAGGALRRRRPGRG